MTQTQMTNWDDVAQSYHALYGQPDVVSPQPTDAQSMASFKVRLEQIQATRQTELAGMLKVLAAQERTIQRLQDELHAVAAQVVAMADKMQAWEADS